MENKKQTGSSSSFTADLFGAKEPLPPSSTGIASIFQPPAKVVGRNSGSELTVSVQKQSSQNRGWSAKQGTHENKPTNSEGASNSIFNKERSSIFQERIDPCPLSSSLYYGGQEDMYIKSSSAPTSGSYHMGKIDGEDDSNGSQGASRGNWWQGSLYY